MQTCVSPSSDGNDRKHVALVRFGRNSRYLCQKHQNVALKLRNSIQLGLPTNPKVLCTHASKEKFEEKPSTLEAGTVKFEAGQWWKLFTEEMALFRERVRRLTALY